jgi:hypothetical protein
MCQLWEHHARKFIFTYKSHGLGQAKPGPSCEWRLWPGLRFEEAKAASGQAKAGAFRPSQARTPLLETSSYTLREVGELAFIRKPYGLQDDVDKQTENVTLYIKSHEPN